MTVIPPVPNTANLIDSACVVVTRIAPGYLNVQLLNGRQNLFDPTVFAGLHLLQEFVNAPANEIKVFVLESGNPDFFIAHLDFASMGTVPDVPGAQNLIERWPAFSHWLSSSSVVSIAKIRGITRGIGNELVLACDMRFASKETARLGQIEVGFGLVPGGGGLEWLPQHVGRGRALEIILSAEDFDADTAALYGWINRALPDLELDDHVDALARRIASYEPAALATAKALIGKRLPPPSVEQLEESFSAILRLASSDAGKAEAARIRALAGGSLVESELDLPNLYGQPASA
jgi:enoyl-CoA hydratase/carnithine racemase